MVYKVDRLTRSLADFAKLVELFDEYGVSFVSITQSFNTTSSMGRLTLNVLLSFAQFEREVIGERVCDKIAASKRKGLWVGGPIPLGYRCIDKKLEIVPEEAEAVCTIFERYLQLGSMGALLMELDRRGIRTKVNHRRNGQKSGGIRFGVGSLAHLLKNRFYVGEVIYRGEVHRGAHEPILTRDLFEESRRWTTRRSRKPVPPNTVIFPRAIVPFPCQCRMPLSPQARQSGRQGDKNAARLSLGSKFASTCGAALPSTNAVSSKRRSPPSRA